MPIRANASDCSISLWMANRPRPSCLASCIAVVALSITRAGSSVAVEVVIPIDALICTSRPSRTNGRSNASRMRRATTVALRAPSVRSAQHHELIAADAGQRVAGPDDRSESFGNLRECGVADLVSERVVDRPEPVEVEVEHADRLAGPFAHRQCMGEPVEQQRPVGEPRQLVVERLLDEALLGFALLGDVAAGRLELADGAVGREDRRDRGLEPAERARCGDGAGGGTGSVRSLAGRSRRNAWTSASRVSEWARSTGWVPVSAAGSRSRSRRADGDT
ncbi:MAG: hypothetical protein R2695_02235 [Acidimicrobiales bacterium]